MSRLVDTVAAELATGIKRATLRKWLQRGHLTGHGHDYYGRAIVDLDEIQALKQARVSACQRSNLASH